MQTEYAMQGEILRLIATQVMDVTSVAPAKHGKVVGALELCGKLRSDPQVAYPYLAKQFQQIGYTVFLRQEREGVSILALPGRLAEDRSRLWVSLLLFFLTAISTIFVGGLQSNGYNIWLGLSFSIALLSILLAHEMGHFLAARYMGVPVSYPFFIPMPFSPIGTMGAFIAMKAPPPDRRALLSIAIAGPLSGLVIAIPVLLLGLYLSNVQVLEPPFFIEGNSLLYAFMKLIVFGRFLPNGYEDVFLHPVAFAGWVGLLVTGLNLIPAGQLDGGHILHALVGPQIARKVTWIIIVVLAVMGYWWTGWLVWATIILLFGRQHAMLRNELVPLNRRQQLIAVMCLIIFILVFTPTPFTIVP